MIVVDTNVLAYLYLPSQFTDLAEALYAREPVWVAPILWRSEFRNVLAGFMRRKEITLDQALALYGEAESLLRGREYEVESTAVLELVRDSDCSSYDCEFIALAKLLELKLVTMDKKLLKAFPQVATPLSSN